MAGSRCPGLEGFDLHSQWSLAPARTSGTLGVLDAGDPNHPSALGDTPGTLGIQDCADPRFQGFHLLTPKMREWLELFEAQLPVLLPEGLIFPGKFYSRGRHGTRKKFYSYGGYEKNGGGNLTAVVRRLEQEGKLKDLELTAGDLDELQGVANAETGGQIMGINTWDNMILSWGFKQWTLGWGEVQKLIQRVPGPFQKFGIELDRVHRYLFTWKKGHETAVPAIKDVPDPEELRAAYWVARFFQAGLDPQVIRAELELALEQHRQLRKRFQAHWSPFLDTGKGRRLIAEVDNNRPAYIGEILKRVHEEIGKKKPPTVMEDEFVRILAAKIEDVYEDRGKDRIKGERLVRHVIG